MEWLVLAGLLLALCFGFVLLFGAPYLPILDKQMEAALDVLDLRPGQTLLELGCGDGKVLVAAAERGLIAVGYELNPLLAAVAWLRTRRYGRRVRVICGNFWNKKWPPADGIFVFLLDRFMVRLDTKIMQSVPKPVKLVSFVFQIPSKAPSGGKDPVFLYEYN